MIPSLAWYAGTRPDSGLLLLCCTRGCRTMETQKGLDACKSVAVSKTPYVQAMRQGCDWGALLG
jgi:hypothetical protein